MKAMILAGLLALSVIFAGFTVFSRIPRRMILGWLAIGLSQSVFLLVAGSEFLCFLNLLFVVASATVLQIYSALFGTAATYAAEKTRTRRDWVYGFGTGATIAAILAFALGGTFSEGTLGPELETAVFARSILSAFPELPWIVAVILFLMIVLAASVGRAGWRRSGGTR